MSKLFKSLKDYSQHILQEFNEEHDNIDEDVFQSITSYINDVISVCNTRIKKEGE